MGTVGRGWIRRGVLKMSEHIILSPSERNIYNLQVSGNTTTTGWKRYYLIDTSASVHITLYHTHTFPDWRPPYKPWFNTESVHCGGMGYQAYNSSFKAATFPEGSLTFGSYTCLGLWSQIVTSQWAMWRNNWLMTQTVGTVIHHKIEATNLEPHQSGTQMTPILGRIGPVSAVFAGSKPPKYGVVRKYGTSKSMHSNVFRYKKYFFRGVPHFQTHPLAF